MSSLVIQHATVISPSDGYNGKADIQITDGKITAVGENLSGDAVIDATGLVAVPGLVDMHVHLRDPGQTAKEDILRRRRHLAASDDQHRAGGRYARNRALYS